MLPRPPAPRPHLRLNRHREARIEIGEKGPMIETELQMLAKRNGAHELLREIVAAQQLASEAKGILRGDAQRAHDLEAKAEFLECANAQSALHTLPTAWQDVRADARKQVVERFSVD
jgi:hypothetical protein